MSKHARLGRTEAGGTEEPDVERERGPRDALPDFNLTSWDGAAPEAIVKPRGDDALGELVLSLAVIFNDLKNMHYALHLLSERRPSERLTPTRAQYSGIIGHAIRWQCGLFQELMKQLTHHRSLLQKREFRALLVGLPAAAREAWDALESVALSPGPERQDKKSTFWLLQRLRNQVAFHYSGHAFVKGYRHWFFERPKSELNRRAVFSDGQSMEETRFFFADAAAEGALATEIPEAQLSFSDLEMRVNKIAEQVNIALKHIVVAYVRRADPKIRPFAVSEGEPPKRRPTKRRSKRKR